MPGRDCGRQRLSHPFIARAVQLLKFARRALFESLEHAVEGGNAGKTGLQRNFRDRQGGVEQEVFRRLDPPKVQVVVKRSVRELLEQPRKMEFREAGDVRHGLKGNIFRIVIVNKLKNLVEFFDIFLLFVGAHVRERPPESKWLRPISTNIWMIME